MHANESWINAEPMVSNSPINLEILKLLVTNMNKYVL